MIAEDESEKQILTDENGNEYEFYRDTGEDLHDRTVRGFLTKTKPKLIPINWDGVANGVLVLD